MTERCDVAVVGAGPVGLLLALLLARRGLDVRLLERREERSSHSRAVGIHPPGLACLADANALAPLLGRGVRVESAVALGAAGELGRVRFERLKGPYPFVLCVPQRDTEQVLLDRLAELERPILRAGHALRGLREHDRGVRLTVEHRGASYALDALYVVGCDGKQSRVRSAAQIGCDGAAYDQHFMMADTPDETTFGSEAAIFLTRAGVVESFPLPGEKRRWVVGLHEGSRPACAATVERLVRERTGRRASAERASMVSAFTAEHYLARTFVSGRVALAGDAAHVISPIGGQGMNLGWLDARALSEALVKAMSEPACARTELARYATTARRRAESARLRAEVFMRVGQLRHFTQLRDGLVTALLSEPLSRRLGPLFTMHGLDATRSLSRVPAWRAS